MQYYEMDCCAYSTALHDFLLRYMYHTVGVCSCCIKNHNPHRCTTLPYCKSLWCLTVMYITVYNTTCKNKSAHKHSKYAERTMLIT
jgi:hypothetical protein